MFKAYSHNDLELKPCPSCGSKPNVMAWFIKGVPNHKNYAVVCQRCGYRLQQPYKFNSIDKAIKWWGIEGEK